MADLTHLYRINDRVTIIDTGQLARIVDMTPTKTGPRFLVRIGNCSAWKSASEIKEAG